MATKKSERESKPVFESAWQLVKPSYEAFLLNAWTLISLIIVPMVIVALLSVFMLPMELAALETLDISVTPDEFFEVIKPHLPSIFAFVILATLIVGISAVAMEYAVLQSARGKKISPLAALQKSLRFILPLVGFGFVVFGMLGLGLLALVIPGLVLLVMWIPRLSIAHYVMFDEKTGPWETFKRSGEIAKVGGLWSAVGVTLVLGIGLSLLSSVFTPFVEDSFVGGIIFDSAITIASLMFVAIIAVRYDAVRKIEKSDKKAEK